MEGADAAYLRDVLGDATHVTCAVPVHLYGGALLPGVDVGNHIGAVLASLPLPGGDGAAKHKGDYQRKYRSPQKGKEAQRKAHRRLLIERFKALDADADGEVDADEFAAGVASTEPGGLTLREAKALFRSVDENGDGTMDQMEFISLMESRHPLLRRVAWAAEIQDALGGGGDDDGGVWVDPNATHVGMISPHGRFRVGWDLATALLLVYVAVIEPLRLGWPSYFASESLSLIHI